MKHYGDMCFSSGEYTDKNGQPKKRWERFGSVMKDDENGRMSIHIPLFDKWFSIFPKQQQQQGQQPQQQNYQQNVQAMPEYNDQQNTGIRTPPPNPNDPENLPF